MCFFDGFVKYNCVLSVTTSAATTRPAKQQQQQYLIHENSRYSRHIKNAHPDTPFLSD
jgi:hypothetical protein